MYHNQAHGAEHWRRTRVWLRRAGLAALSVRRVGVTLGVAGCVLVGAAVAPGGAGPAAAAAGHRAG